ncbi:MAG TPA: hypothetical protein VEA59_02000 [Patescibacteria group bacterium]|nr:hypothetical protein [Patescibacteria group bacterium]
MKYGVLPNILPSRPGQSPLLTAVEADDFLLASILRAGNELYGNIRISREDKQCAARVWAERYPKDAELAIQHEWMGAAHAIAWMLGV